MTAGAVALVHGFTGAPASWDDVATGLAPHVSVLRPIVPGHVGTHIDRGWRFVDVVDRMAARLRAEAPGSPLHLCGYSLGARISLGLLARHPDRFSGATLIGVHPGLADDTQRQSRQARDEGWARLLETRGLEEFAERWAHQPLFATQAALPAARRRRRQEIRLSHDPQGLANALRVLGLAQMPCWGPVLPELSMPVRLVAGEHDAKFCALARDAVCSLPHGRVTIVDDAGHDVVLERPDAVIASLLHDLDVQMEGACVQCVAGDGGAE